MAANESGVVERGRNGKTVQLTAQLRDEIVSGLLLPGHKLPSFAEMRRVHGVAPLTTDRIYAQLEREGLIVRENGRGVFVSERKKPRTGIIGFSGAAPLERSGKRSAYFGALLEGVQHAAFDAGYEVLLLHPNSLINWEKMDGVLVSLGFAHEVAQKFPPGMPFVSLLMKWTDVPSVLSEDYQAMCTMTRHLLEQGHRRIALFSAGDNDYSLMRRQAYLDTLRAYGVEPDPRWLRDIRAQEIPGDFVRLGQLRMRQWLEEDWHQLGCTALMAYNDHSALGAIEALEAAGLRVPHDISVTGFDGIALPAGQPNLTTAAVALESMGARGFQDLQRWIEEGTLPENAHFPAQFRQGSTTSAPP